jgi:beta-hydroxylase
MLKQLLAPQLIGLYILIACTLYVHFRGRERHKISRPLGDHSTYLAPYNVRMYAGSAVPNKPVIPVDRFPELAKLSDNWQTIRDEAVTRSGTKAPSTSRKCGSNKRAIAARSR